MQSRISIEVDFENGNTPVIQIVGRNSITNPDVRDSLVQTFLQSFQGGDYLAKINFKLVDRDSSELSFHSKAIITPLPIKIPEPAPQFFSRFSIGDSADYTTNAWYKEGFEKAKKENPKKKEDDLEFIPHYSYGKVVAVKFTEAKVYYDVLDDFTGKIVKEVDSSFMKSLAPDFSSKK